MNSNSAPLRPELAGGAQPLSAGRRVVTLLSAARPEILLAQLGLVLIAAHVIDDNFVQPQPGTSAGDHLVSGLVPTIALLLFAAFYGRMRTGLRATLAVVVGLFGVTSGVERGGVLRREDRSLRGRLQRLPGDSRRAAARGRGSHGAVEVETP